MRISVADYSTSVARPQSAAVLPDQKAADDLAGKAPVGVATEGASSTPKASLETKPMSWARMSFDVDLSSRSIKVTLSDRNSGEVYRELVYDRGGLLRTLTRPGSGQWVNKSV